MPKLVISASDQVLFLAQRINDIDKEMQDLQQERDLLKAELNTFLVDKEYVIGVDGQLEEIGSKKQRAMTLANRVCMVMMYRPTEIFTAKSLVDELGMSNSANIRQVLAKLAVDGVVEKVKHGHWKFSKPIVKEGENPEHEPEEQQLDGSQTKRPVTGATNTNDGPKLDSGQ
jgi:hypothetical protein